MTPDAAVRHVRKRPTVAAAMLLALGEAAAAICGGTGDWWRQFQYALPIIPRRAGVSPDLCVDGADLADRACCSSATRM